MVHDPRNEAELVPSTDEVRAALARSLRESDRLRKLLKITRRRDADDLAKPQTARREAVQ